MRHPQQHRLGGLQMPGAAGKTSSKHVQQRNSHHMGVSAECCCAGRELDLRKLHEAIQECGGFEAAVSNKKFARIAIKLGIDLAVATNAAYLLK